MAGRLGGVLTVSLCFITFIVTRSDAAASAAAVRVPYEPTWESLDARPLPGWFDQAKVGVFIHWGVFSVTQLRQRVVLNNYPPGFKYQDFAPQFTAEFFNPKQWVDIFAASGAKYVVLTAKHHEGYTMWGSPASWNWNAVDVGPKRDLAKTLPELYDLVTRYRPENNYPPGFKYQDFAPQFTAEFFNPKQWVDIFAASGAKYVVLTAKHHEAGPGGFRTSYFPEAKTLPELYDLVTRYRPEVLCPVRDTVVTNDRWGRGCICQHGGYYTPLHALPPAAPQVGELHDHRQPLLGTLVQTVSLGGNLLVNVGPTHDGRIAPIFEERLRQMGSWLAVNGEAIYNTSAWRSQNDTLTPGLCEPALDPPRTTQVDLLGYGPLQWRPMKPAGLQVLLPQLSVNQMPCQWAWALRLTGVK
ncbi:LOW QUALITY PROTEIN: hypothetical protein CRUP_030927 [Coryphaenoides rupestris]|nr:LOW QUALITY PROTEIN: hypothetical protein CRUP_030927 [Coryphaenoides rupestris]